MYTKDHIELMNAVPRPEEVKMVEEERPKSPWTIPKSIFANF